MSRDDYDENDRRNPTGFDRPKWRVLTTEFKGENAAVEISILDLEIPRYSFRVGTAHFPRNEGDPITVTPRLTVFNVQDAILLLGEVSDKYLALREQKIDELESRKTKALKRARGETPEVMVKRKP